jgi:hypothetical protein
MKERRRLRRRYLLAEVKFKTLRGSLPVRAQCMNIHREGMGLYSKKSFREGDPVGDCHNISRQGQDEAHRGD